MTFITSWRSRQGRYRLLALICPHCGSPALVARRICPICGLNGKGPAGDADYNGDAAPRTEPSPSLVAEAPANEPALESIGEV